MNGALRRFRADWTLDDPPSPRSGRGSAAAHVDAFDRSGAGPFAAHGTQFNRPVGDREAERRADRAVDEAQFAAMRADEFGGDRKAEPGAAVARRALEGLE